MKLQMMNTDREMFDIIKGLIKSLRLFQSESVFCENITFTQFIILDYVVSEKGRMGMSALHPLLGVEKSTTTRLVAPLIKTGLLNRVKSEEDLRAVDLKITDEGRGIHEKVWLCITNYLGGCCSSIPESDRGGVLKAIRVFISSLEKCCTTPSNYCCNTLLKKFKGN